MSDLLVHRKATDGKTICGRDLGPTVKAVGVFQPNKVTCAPCARSATTTHDPANWMLKDGHTSTTTVYNEHCYICRDPEFAQMGLPLCYPCPLCVAEPGDEQGHVPADDTVCTVCKRDTYPPEAEMLEGVAQITDVPTGDFL